MRRPLQYVAITHYLPCETHILTPTAEGLILATVLPGSPGAAGWVFGCPRDPPGPHFGSHPGPTAAACHLLFCIIFDNLDLRALQIEGLEAGPGHAPLPIPARGYSPKGGVLTPGPDLLPQAPSICRNNTLFTVYNPHLDLPPGGPHFGYCPLWVPWGRRVGLWMSPGPSRTPLWLPFRPHGCRTSPPFLHHF